MDGMFSWQWKGQRWRLARQWLILSGVTALAGLLCVVAVLVWRFGTSGQRPVFRLTPQQLSVFRSDDSRLLDFDHFRYVIQPTDTCAGNRGDGLYFIVYVHSAPAHFQEREVIRSTWGSVRGIGRWGVRLVFLLGLTSDHLQRRLVAEGERHGDVLQGNFVDTYRNLSYKHLMGYKWVVSRCPEVKFIVKADDDAYVDVVQLHRLLREMYGSSSSSTSGVLACSVWPEGSSPQRSPRHKWAVSPLEYPHRTYPAYCAGLAYVLSPSTARALLAASHHVPFFWIDDLYVTGLLVESVPWLRHHALNLRTTYDWQALLRWLRQPGHRNVTAPSPYIFGDVSGSKNQTAFMRQLWRKTVSVWKNEKVVYR